MVVCGIPLDTSNDFIKKFLRDKIPNAKNVRVPIDKEKGTTKGKAFVDLSSEANVKVVLCQVKGLEMGVRRLKIYEIKPREEERPSGDGRYGGGSFRGGNSGGGGFGCGSSGGGFGECQSDNNQRGSGFRGRGSASSSSSSTSDERRFSFGRDSARDSGICRKLKNERKFKLFTLKIHDIDENERHELQV